jgi:hypothetical protein
MKIDLVDKANKTLLQDEKHICEDVIIKGNQTDGSLDSCSAQAFWLKAFSHAQAFCSAICLRLQLDAAPFLSVRRVQLTSGPTCDTLWR